MNEEYVGEDEEWSEFEVWYDTQITRFFHGQFSDKEKAYAAWLKGKRVVFQQTVGDGISKLIENQEDIPPEFSKAVDEHFDELI